MPLASTGNYLARLAKFETAASIEYAAWSPLAMRLINEGLYKKPFVSRSGRDSVPPH